MRARYLSGQHNTLVVDTPAGTEVFRLDHPDDVNRLFDRLKFPHAHVGSGIISREEPLGPRVIFHRTYLQAMPGEAQAARLIWCCELLPDRDPEPPVVLTPQEARRRYGLKTD